MPCELTVILSFSTCTPPTRALLTASCTAFTTSTMLRSGAVSAGVSVTVTGLPPFTVFMVTVNAASLDNRPTRPDTSVPVRIRSTPSTVAATWLARKPIWFTAAVPLSALSSSVVTPPRAFSTTRLPSATACTCDASAAAVSAVLMSETRSETDALVTVSDFSTVTSTNAPPLTLSENPASLSRRP